jgi:hypothetical protein
LIPCIVAATECAPDPSRYTFSAVFRVRAGLAPAQIIIALHQEIACERLARSMPLVIDAGGDEEPPSINREQAARAPRLARRPVSS